MLERTFNLRRQGTTVRTELLAGLTTFLTMAYITVVNPAILTESGMDFGAVFAATCLAAAFGTLMMGLVANYPIALAPGMGLNAFFTYDVVLTLGYSWQVALGAVFISGLLFLLLSVLPVREWIINAIPHTLKLAISAGIGLFLALIGLKNAGIIVDQPTTLVTLGDLSDPTVLLALIGFYAIVALYSRRVPGAVIIGILMITAAGVLLGVSQWHGLFATPPDIRPTLLQLDIRGALELSLVAVIFTFLFVDLFDTAGTLIGVAHRAGFLDHRGRLRRLRPALIADSSATVLGAMLGTSPTTSYVESATGINAGGRTGLTAMVVAALFLLCLFFSPLAQSIPAYATAPALLFVGCLMTRGLTAIRWDDVTEYAPAVVTAIAIPLTFSIAHGIGLGFISFVLIKVFSGRLKECSPPVCLISLLFGAKFAFA